MVLAGQVVLADLLVHVACSLVCEAQLVACEALFLVLVPVVLIWVAYCLGLS